MIKSEHWRQGEMNLKNNDNEYLKEKIREVEKLGLTIKEKLELLSNQDKMKG